jgi:hypothetical protein
MFEGTLRESYHLRSESQSDAVALLERANLPGYVLPPKNGWVPIYAEGAPFSDNLALVSSADRLVVHFFHLPDSIWSLRLFHRNKLVGTFEGHASGIPLDRSWRLPKKVLETLALSAAEKGLLARLCAPVGSAAPGASATSPVTAVDMLDFFGLPDGWLNYRVIAEAKGIGCSLPDGTVHVEPNTPPPACSPDPALLDSDDFRFPVICFGDHRSVTSAVNKLGRSLRKSTDPNAVLAAVERVPFRELGNEVFFGQGMFGTGGERAWRPYAIAKAVFGDSNPPLKEPAVSVLETVAMGMEHFWFALGLLGEPDIRCHWMVTAIDVAERLKLLRGFVRWAPQLFALAPFLTDKPSGQRTLRRPPWAGNIISSAVWVGWKISNRELEATYAGDWCRAMLETGVIERDGESFRVTEKFARRAK